MNLVGVRRLLAPALLAALLAGCDSFGPAPGFPVSLQRLPGSASWTEPPPPMTVEGVTHGLVVRGHSRCTYTEGGRSTSRGTELRVWLDFQFVDNCGIVGEAPWPWQANVALVPPGTYEVVVLVKSGDMRHQEAFRGPVHVPR